MKKVAKLIESRQKINKEIEDIQKRCPHFNTSIKQIRENLDSVSPSIRYVCDECSMILGYPNDKEIKKYLNG
jgi:uncharacterized coiled-coil DUF342 family protein